MNNQSVANILFFVGLSGCGKSTLQTNLINMKPEKYSRIISTTTRAPREGEVDGLDYFFISKEKFLEMEADGKFLQTVKLEETDTYYGTQMSVYHDMMPNGIFVCTPEGVNDTMNALNKKGINHIRPIIVFFDVSHDLVKSHGVDQARIDRADFGKIFKEFDNRGEFEGIPKIILKDENIDERLPEEFDGYINELLGQL